MSFEGLLPFEWVQMMRALLPVVRFFRGIRDSEYTSFRFRPLIIDFCMPLLCMINCSIASKGVVLSES